MKNKNPTNSTAYQNAERDTHNPEPNNKNPEASAQSAQSAHNPQSTNQPNEPSMEANQPSEPNMKTKQPTSQSYNPDNQIAALTEDLKRTRADFENYRKRIDQEKSQMKELGREQAIIKILPLLDAFSLAISAHQELAPLAKTLEKSISDLGLRKIPAATDADFNPDLHEAISAEDQGGDREVINQVLRDGYYLDTTVLRPALVSVKKI